MNAVTIDNVSFAYSPLPAPQAAIIHELSFMMPEGGFCVITGPTGSGKSTLLRLLKPELRPRGKLSGNISLHGVPIVKEGRALTINPQASAQAAAYVAQDPEAQIVCDTVRAELAFGLENLGIAPNIMRRHIAEATSFLGIDGWLNRKTANLSGGQKQLLNLAAALALQPKLLLLDEPTAQLDPSSRRHFLTALQTVNRELGISVMVASHTPELLQSMATQQLALGSLPDPAPYSPTLQLNAQPSEKPKPNVTTSNSANTAPPSPLKPVITAKDVFIRYSQNQPWVLQGADATLIPGKVLALVGGNGSGKTTLLKVLAGAAKPQRGRVHTQPNLRRVYLPQDPKVLFCCDTVLEELHEWHARFNYSQSDELAIATQFQLEDMLERHPYDMSGGQQQRLALAKLMLTQPEALLLDEPTKGLDAQAAADVVRAIKTIAAKGAAIALATHDLSLIRLVAHEVALVFDGMLACKASTETFFNEGLVYQAPKTSRLYGALQI